MVPQVGMNLTDVKWLLINCQAGNSGVQYIVWIKAKGIIYCTFIYRRNIKRKLLFNQ